MPPEFDTNKKKMLSVQTCEWRTTWGQAFHGAYPVKHQLLAWLGGDFGKGGDGEKEKQDTDAAVFGLY